jgi:hypothetical protein
MEQRWAHHRHPLIKCKMSHRGEEEHDTHCKISGKPKVPLMVKDF